MADWSRVLKFWFEEVAPADRFSATPELDDRIREEFAGSWDDAVAGKLDDWLTDSSSGLALLILLDQFPRNMFRGSAKAFASDARARRNASLMIERDLDLALPPERRHFVYLPFMHSEDPADQDRCIKFIRERMAENGEENLLHARAHKEIIHRFGRFPYRNQALGRINTREEDDWLKGGGYGAIVNEIRNADACPPDAVTDP